MTSPSEEEPDLARVLEFIRRSQGFDGRLYKPNYIKRRLSVRMRAVGAQTHREYLKVLNADPAESGALFKRLTIHVTDFFRDPEVYRALETNILPKWEAAAGRDPGGLTVRAWCAGCSTGEEPYSLALMLADWARSSQKRDFSILATDIDETSIQAAMKGEYPETAVARVRPDRLTLGFTRVGGKVRATEALRSRVRFKVHDLLGPWPVAWSSFDLIFCRNLLIYLRAVQQQQLYLWFHGALNPDGFLVLGRTEALLGKARRFFECVNIPNRIYRPLAGPNAFELADAGEGPSPPGKG